MTALKQTEAAAARVDLTNWAAHYSINPAAVEALQSMLASTPAALGIDLAPRPMATAPRDGTMLRLLVRFDDHATEDTEGPAWTIGACNDDNVHQDEGAGWQFAGWCWDHDHFTEGKGTPVGWLPLIDASPKGGSKPASRIELTNGQIAQLADFAGTPVAAEPLDEQDVLVIQHADAGHSGPGLYAHYDELPEEGAIYLDGQLPGSPNGGGDGCYFSADPALGEFITHASLQAAIDSAESMLSDAGDDANESGWTDDSPQICYGIVLGQCVEVDGSRKPAPEGSEFTEHVEFKLQATSAEVGS